MNARREVWTYRGRMIHRDYSPNSWGLRYWSLSDSGRIMRGQTLAGMRELIREEVMS